MIIRLLVIAVCLASAWYVFQDAQRKGRPIIGFIWAIVSLFFPLAFVLYWALSPRLIKTPTTTTQLKSSLCTKCGTENESNSTKCKKCKSPLDL